MKAFAVFVFVLSIWSSLQSRSGEWENLGKVEVEHMDSDSGPRYKRATNGMPDVVNFRLTQSGSQVDLKLKRSARRNGVSELPVLIIENGVVVKETLPPMKFAATYISDEQRSAMIVRRLPDGKFSLEGTFVQGSREFQILPEKDSGHQLRRKTARRDYGNDYIVLNDSLKSGLAETIGIRKKRAITSNHTIEILFVADYKDYFRWYTNLNKTKSLAESEMQLYYACIANSMSLRCDSVTEINPNLQINILVTGLLIITDPDVSKWTSQIATLSGTVDAKVALESFQDWVGGQRSLRANDHWMLFTGYDLERNGRTVVAGLAKLGSMCSDSLESVSIIEQDYSGSVGATAAHELGHSLSAEHDEDEPECQDERNYVMSSKLVTPKHESNASRPWLFSTCSVTKMGTFLSGVTCTLQSKFDQSVIRTDLHAGQLYSADVQCKMALGEKSYFGRRIQSKKGFDTMCRFMYCALPGVDYYFQKIFAFGRTSCGDGKWCVKGKCVRDDDAPRTKEKCPQGDDENENCKAENCDIYKIIGKFEECCNTCGASLAAPEPTNSLSNDSDSDVKTTLKAAALSTTQMTSVREPTTEPTPEPTTKTAQGEATLSTTQTTSDPEPTTKPTPDRTTDTAGPNSTPWKQTTSQPKELTTSHVATTSLNTNNGISPPETTPDSGSRIADTTFQPASEITTISNSTNSVTGDNNSNRITTMISGRISFLLQQLMQMRRQFSVRFPSTTSGPRGFICFRMRSGSSRSEIRLCRRHGRLIIDGGIAWKNGSSESNGLLGTILGQFLGGEGSDVGKGGLAGSHGERFRSIGSIGRNGSGFASVIGNLFRRGSGSQSGSSLNSGGGLGKILGQFLGDGAEFGSMGSIGASGSGNDRGSTDMGSIGGSGSGTDSIIGNFFNRQSGFRRGLGRMLNPFRVLNSDSGNNGRRGSIFGRVFGNSDSPISRGRFGSSMFDRLGGSRDGNGRERKTNGWSGFRWRPSSLSRGLFSRIRSGRRSFGSSRRSSSYSMRNFFSGF